ncbi:M48 family metallopeptidase [Salmonella enterica]|uniref:M48 family metallopeptidase n=1 Tax=Salmonella enterica TaxID=28901 RepID=UPI0009B155B4|nr:SprT family zinc-dependent metalloprotease [Salmonella enterica]EAB7163823.1 M48 family peptidase [Salmonella enterica subsp. enterica]EBW4444760.1 M48 family peptidase [Salmonella enterica subsp. enterica serovar Arechavaleta]EBY6722955.1 M48 family peptidase [Salmonella enterica subsp. enterica serovar Ndolo]EBZ5785353.1 M48 family peptidase [Salmonella enterica subsp. enterica serovar Lawndale]ECC3676502.1 M48 family peptidase [Salmonella enterica subsp. enterica serovar Miami]EDU961877
MSFIYGDEWINFDREPRPYATSRVLIKVHPDCRVVVSAPEEADDLAVLTAVKKRGRWIYQQLRDFRRQLEYITPRKYISGESHYYLGKQYLLKVIEEPAEVQRVKMLRGKLEVTLRQKSPEKVRQLLIDWYKTRAKNVFAKRLEAMLEQALWVNAPPPLRVLTMQTQWGSCSPSGRLTLNPNLVKAPRECIDYVILHELCHLAEHNHSERFYRLMGQVMPEWEVVKTRLDGMAGVIYSDL